MRRAKSHQPFVLRVAPAKRARSRSTGAGLALALLLAACGDGLYDAEGLPATDGGGLTCNDNQVVCPGENKCRQETVRPVGTDRWVCGSACTDCTTVDRPGNTIPICNLGRAADGHGTCGYACADGFFACAGGCCGSTLVAAGGTSSYAIVSDGTLRAWGANAAGQLGDGSRIARLAPALVKLAGGEIASALGAGPDHACAVVIGGAVRCWGENSSGQVTGAPTSGAVSTPTATPVSAGAIAVAAGASHTCALLGTGAVTCWGANTLGQLSGASAIAGATAIAAGRRHTCAVVAGGAVKCWGANDQGQLGATPSGGVATPITSGIQHLAAYQDHTCVATGASNGEAIDDAVRCFGNVLGATFGLAEPQLTPAIPMKRADQSTIRSAASAIATGLTHVCAKTGDGLLCFGTDNAKGQLGGTPQGVTEAAAVSPPAGATFSVFATGDDHACSVLSTGALRCWGSNDAGQLGDGTTDTPGVATLVAPVGT